MFHRGNLQRNAMPYQRILVCEMHHPSLFKKKKKKKNYRANLQKNAMPYQRIFVCEMHHPSLFDDLADPLGVLD